MSAAAQTTIMIVEDELDASQLLDRLLTREGYRVLKAANGRLALELLEAGERPKLILCDLMMPIMSGWELIAELEAKPELAQLEVVILSASAYSDNLAGHLFLRKPIDLNQLLSIIRDRCGAGTTSNN